ncbi:MAG TPA: carboxypeptidase-like regulatory domain-containing protein [Lacipirellulaceae bacterium]|nr:carboxypeptidase-like regulatory domain-containing protein [Lacipirellulaceae bacterium]
MAFGLPCHWASWVALALIFVPMVAGCGRSEHAAVSGTLLRRGGTPLVGARIVATSRETGKSAYGTTDDAGQFELGVGENGDGIPPGDYDVIIVEDRGDPDNRRPPAIAAKYGDARSSGLQFSAEAGELKQLNITLDPP